MPTNESDEKSRGADPRTLRFGTVVRVRDLSSLGVITKVNDGSVFRYNVQFEDGSFEGGVLANELTAMRWSHDDREYVEHFGVCESNWLYDAVCGQLKGDELTHMQVFNRVCSLKKKAASYDRMGLNKDNVAEVIVKHKSRGRQ